MARAKGEGWYETRKADGWVRHVRQSQFKKLAGPYKPSQKAALEAWSQKVKRIGQEREAAERAEREEQEAIEERSLGGVIYFCLFGVWSSPDGVPPTTKGPWAYELAETTYNNIRDAFRTDIRHDPVARKRPADVTLDDLEGMRQRMLMRRTSYERTQKIIGSRRKGLRITETVERPLRNPRTVERYMQGVCKALAREGNHVYKQLGALKLPPPKKGWLAKRDRGAFLKALGRDDLRLAARLMLHGMCRGEVAALTPEQVTHEGIVIEIQTLQTKGGAKDSKSLKRPLRYRTVPISDELRTELLEYPPGEKIIGLTPGGIYQGIVDGLRDTRFAHLTPHDLRRSGGKWMLDDGAKLNDVAAILGNDPRTLLLWYDTADREGMQRAVQSVA